MSFPAGAALAVNRRVKLASGVLQYAGATDIGIGTLLNATWADTNKASGYTDGTVKLWVSDETHKFVASDAITADNTFYAAANGKVASSGTITVGVAFETTTADGDVFEGMNLGNADVSTSIGGTTGAAFLVDSDSAIPKIELASFVGGTGDYKVTIKPASTLTGNRVATIQDSASQVLVARDTTDTLTNKTLTSPVVNTPTIKDLTEVVSATNVIAATETGSVFFLNSATEFVSTLPAPAAGLKFRFIVSAAPSGASYTIVTNSSANIILGHIVSAEDANGSGDSETSGGDTISFVDGQAVVGDMVEVFCDGTNWFAYGRSKVVAGITITTAS